MSSELSRFRIDALHNIRTIDVPIEDNKLVLVGENGTGKSTVANLIYFFLTRQWHRMLNYQFRSITATINSKEITIPRDDLTKWRLTERDRSRLSRLLPNSTIEAIRNMLVHRSIDEVIKSNEILQYSNRHGIPRSVLMDFIYEFNEQQVLTPTLENAIHTLDHLVTDQVLYLPTYRRIEQDLVRYLSLFKCRDRD